MEAFFIIYMCSNTTQTQHIIMYTYNYSYNCVVHTHLLYSGYIGTYVHTYVIDYVYAHIHRPIYRLHVCTCIGQIIFPAPINSNPKPYIALFTHFICDAGT